MVSRLSHTTLASYGLDGKRDHGACVGLTSCAVCGACACVCRSVVCLCVLHCAHGLGWCWVAFPRRSVPRGFIVQPRHRRMGHGGRDEHAIKCVRPLRISPLQRRRERSVGMQHDHSLPPHMRTHCALKLVFSALSYGPCIIWTRWQQRPRCVRWLDVLCGVWRMRLWLSVGGVLVCCIVHMAWLVMGGIPTP